MAEELERVGKLSLVDAKIEHVDEIKDRLRFPDVRECLIHGVSPTQALTDPFYVLGARNFSIRFDEKIIGMCGTVPIDNSHARVWMLGTEDIDENWISFLKGSRKVVDILQGTYQKIENFIPIDHDHTIMWLQWCGFELDENMYEVSSHSMVRFIRCKKTKNNVYYLPTRPVMH